MIVVDLSKQQALDAHPKAIKQINFTANLDRPGNTGMYFILFIHSQTFHRELYQFCECVIKYNFI